MSGLAFKMVESSLVSINYFSSALAESVESFSHKTLKQQQKECVYHIVSYLRMCWLFYWHAGFRKSAIFGALHWMEMGKTKQIIISVVL